MKHESRKAQVSIEYLSTISVLLIAIAVLVGYAYVVYPDYVKISTMNNSLRSLKSAVNSVYSLGPGNSETVSIEIPSEMQSAVVINNMIRFTYLDGSETGIFVNPNIHGSLPTAKGTYTILVRAVDENVLLQEI